MNGEMEPLTGRIFCVYDNTKLMAQTFATQVITNFTNITLVELEQLATVVQDNSTIIALGGDGFLLKVMHCVIHKSVEIYGINYGTVGFLMNKQCNADTLLQKIALASNVQIHPLCAEITTQNGTTLTEYAINEMTALRETGQVAKLEIKINNVVRIQELVSDGIIVATPAGSSAYNFSLHGPIFGFKSNLLSLQPIGPFRPRHWRGALLDDESVIEITVLEQKKRLVSLNADYIHIPNISHATIKLCKEKYIKLLFDADMPIEEKLLQEQFMI